ncbi:ABC transporter substrate-binding protein [Siccirubricoccus sp. KC 17139]|uniref:ABC transporter substrate-binding protein n=1 Tax=Siccirubricoccus soli TaxID=2899147 RepID=A0ABT1D1D9_9PROT|nr:ABC transporter substrate-binding protein [Siccirubricoccus soli]MCO6415732.1 ABC transporter substrate-binding protein [Siccirubricoccus soli]MCP2681864.1 ABC transporter substrate-binding protein [Siccirubricoccus soli]
MVLQRRDLLGTAAAAAAGTVLPRRRARAQAQTIRIGVLTDMSGPYRDNAGPGSVVLTQQAVQDFGSRGFNVEVLQADHQNKPDVGASITRQWFDQGVDVVADIPTSSVALAANQIAREKNKVHLNSGAATSDLTGPACSPNMVHWTYDTYMLAKSTGAAIVKTGGDSWFFITADYAFGHALERDTGNFVKAQGGKVLGSARYPFPATTDFSAFLLQARASRANVLGLANAGTDTVNAILGAREFGLQRSMKIAALLMGIYDVKAVGLESGQGLLLTEAFYWDLNDRTRALTQRVKAKNQDRPPAMEPAGCYGMVLHYLKAVADMGVAAAKASGADAVARMKAMPTDDDAFGAGTIRADGRKIHPSYLFEVKAPGESRNPWDLYKLAATTPAEEAFRPLAEGNCPLVRS